MNPEAIYKTLIQTGDQMAEAQFEFRQLDDQTKSILAQNTMLAKDIPDVKSVAEATQIALAASDYRDHLLDVAKSQMVYLKARVKYEASKSLFEAQRTQEASSRFAERAQQ